MILKVLALLAIPTFLTGCGQAPGDGPSAKELATNVHFLTAGKTITLPSVAVAGAWSSSVHYSPNDEDDGPTERRKLIENGKNPQLPISVERLDIYFAYYAGFGERTGSSQMCPLLSAGWAKDMCSNYSSEMRKRLPGKILLMEGDGSLQGIFSNDRMTVEDFQVADAHNYVCTATSCFGGVQLTPKLTAVWDMHSHSPEPTRLASQQEAVRLLFTQISS